MIGSILTVLGFIAAAALTVPLLVFIGGAILAKRGIGGLWHSAISRRIRDSWKTRVLEADLRRLRNDAPYPSPEEFEQDCREALQSELPGMAAPVLNATGQCARRLYENEAFASNPLRPGIGDELAMSQHWDLLLHSAELHRDPNALEAFRVALLRSLTAIVGRLPQYLRNAERQSTNHEPDSEALIVRLLDLLSDVPNVIEAATEPYQSEAVLSRHLYRGLRERLDRNRHKVSGQSYVPFSNTLHKLVAPSDYEGSADEIVDGYLGGTPFEPLLKTPVPFPLPDSARAEHMWVVGGSGHGKTQALQYLIGRDLDRVARGEASVIVIDSQGDMIRTIAGLGLFAPGQPLHDRLCLIDPTDIEYPVALNLFDTGIERYATYSLLDRERLLNGILELYDFVLGSLLSAEMTAKQGVIFRYITRLMLHIPGATIHTLREVMEPGGCEKYKPYIAALDPTPRTFFETEFNSRQFEDTKRQVVRRLWSILENRTFERMFSNPKSKFDMFTEMNAGKVILINTAKDLLKETGTQIFGRFFIALIVQAAQERAAMPKEARKPCFVYVDEAQEYFDQNVSTILEQARKQSVAICAANQHLGQLSPRLLDSFTANTSIKMAGGCSDKDARAFASMMRCTPDFVHAQQKGYFATWIRNCTPTAVSLQIPIGHLESMLKMTWDEANIVRAEMRQRYATCWNEPKIMSPGPSTVASGQSPDPTAPVEW